MGEPAADTPPPIVDAAVAALRAGRTRYAQLSGSPTLREAIARAVSDAHGIAIGPDAIVCSHGGSGGLAAAILATVDPGDRVVVPEPTYSLYADQVALAGGVVTWVPPGAGDAIDVDAVCAALPGARMLVLCSPGNPTGAVIERDALQALSDAAAATGAYLLCDEAYADIVFDDLPFCSSLELAAREHVICCRTLSKSYAMTGWRLGYVVADPSVADAINLVHRTFCGGLATFSQDAAEVAMATPRADLERHQQWYRERRDLVLDVLGDMPGVHVRPPRGAFYAFVRVETRLSSDELVARIATAGVIVRSGREFGPSCEHAFRLSFATDATSLATGLERIAAVLREIAA